MATVVRASVEEALVEPALIWDSIGPRCEDPDRIADMSDPTSTVDPMNARHLSPAHQLPDRAAHLAGEPELAAAWEQEVAERQAQAVKVRHLLTYKARKVHQNKDQHSFTRQAVEKTIIRDAAAVLGMTESAVRRLLTDAEFLSQKLPKTWASYTAGAIDRGRAKRAARAAEDIAHRDDLLPVIDAEIAARAPQENAASLDAWLKRRVPELDTAAFEERYERAQTTRYVVFHHRGDGMTRIDALIPTLVAAPLEQEIYARARNTSRTVADSATEDAGIENTAQQGQALEDNTLAERTVESRTLTQRIADAFTDWLHSTNQLRTAKHSEHDGAAPPIAAQPAPVHAKIGILVPLQTLARDSDAPAISWDRSWSLPADQVRRIATDPDADHDWYLAGTRPGPVGHDEIVTVVHRKKGPALRAAVGPQKIAAGHSIEHPAPARDALQDWINTADPVAGNLLTKSYQSRTSRDKQREAVLLRDGQCVQPGCSNSGWRAEIDHKQSFETGGQTTGTNLQVLCHDHHQIKSHNLGHGHDATPGKPSVASAPRSPPPRRRSAGVGGAQCDLNPPVVP